MGDRTNLHAFNLSYIITKIRIDAIFVTNYEQNFLHKFFLYLYALSTSDSQNNLQFFNSCSHKNQHTNKFRFKNYPFLKLATLMNSFMMKCGMVPPPLLRHVFICVLKKTIRASYFATQFL